MLFVGDALIGVGDVVDATQWLVDEGAFFDSRLWYHDIRDDGR